MKVYTIIGGVNGTGKSSLTGVLRTQLKDLGRIIDVDRITAENGLTSMEGGREALRRIRECLDKNVCFTQETTLSGHRTEKTAAEAREKGYSVRLFYIGLDRLYVSDLCGIAYSVSADGAHWNTSSRPSWSSCQVKVLSSPKTKEPVPFS